MKYRHYPALAVLAVLGAPLPAFCATPCNNLGPGDTFIINREYDTNFTFLASDFVTASGGYLGSILTPLFSLDSPITFGLYNDASGKPGTLLEG
ncbi:MAG TPA: hypothetical protein VLW52_05620 [Opitutaceae bacterium]|nr:hypothetical protein [Opitutaceae bacterium]